jgi:hypothetical protein
MTAKLASDEGKACYAKRKQTVEPVFGQIKDVRGARRFQRRGLRACTTSAALRPKLPRVRRATGDPLTPPFGNTL